MFSRTLRRLNMTSTTMSAPYTGAVVNAMRRLYPEALADKSFDNTGLLLEAPFDPQRRQKNSVLLTVDLTKAAADEAIERRDSIVVAYHPIIFRGLKSLTLGDTQQQTLLRLASQGISVYSPHTAIDCASGGLGDWLADIVTGTPTAPEARPSKAAQSTQSGLSLSNKKAFGDSIYILQHHPSQLSFPNSIHLGNETHRRYPIQATKVSGHPDAGMGRIVRFSEPVPLIEIVHRISLGLGKPQGFPLAIPQGKRASEISITSVGICAGSGGHLFGDMEKNGEDVDLLFTGELSHHEALAAIEKGKCVISLFHSNTERGFLHTVLKPQLETAIKAEWEKIRSEERTKTSLSGSMQSCLDDDQVNVHVSERDRDPYGIMFSKDFSH